MEEIDLKELLTLFWNKKIKIITIMIIFIIIGIIYTENFVKPMYTSSTTLVLAKAENNKNTTNNTNSEETKNTTNSITTTDITLNSKLISTYRELVKSKSVIRQVIKNLRININEEELRKNITVDTVENTELIKISVTNEDAEKAYKIATEIAKVFSEIVLEMYNINNVHIVDKAKINYTPSNINKIRDIIIFTGIGLIISIIYVLLTNMLDTTIKKPEDIEKEFKIPVLATIPKHNFNAEKGGKKK